MTLAKRKETLNVNCFVANHILFVVGQPQKKYLSHIIVKQRKKLK